MRNHPAASQHKRLWRRVRVKVFDRDGWRCQDCGKAGALECDHIRAVKDGGAWYELDNLRTLCRGCHIARTARQNAKEHPERDAWLVYITGMV